MYIKLSSLNDLCRYASNFDYTNSCIMSIKYGNGYRLFSVGEDICGASIAYYINIGKPEHVISYTYPAFGEPENPHFVESPDSQQNKYMSIINISSAEFCEAKTSKGKRPIMVQLSSTLDLVNAAIRRGISSESISQIYAFEYRGRMILCCFDVLEEFQDDERTMYYAIAESRKASSFVRYKYADNKVDFTDYMGEHSYMYAKIINLAEPFPFFKMPN